MNLAIVNLTRGSLSGGYSKYLRRIVPLIEQHSSIKKISVFVPQQMEVFFNSLSKNFMSWPTGDDKRGFEWLRKNVSKSSPDVVFFPMGRYVNFTNIPAVVMIQNMEPLSVPFGGNPLMEIIKNFGRAYFAKKACHKAVRIIAVSKYVKDFLIRQWHIDPERVGVVYLGADFLTGLNSWQMPSSLIAPEKHGFIFTAGSIRPARGLEDIIMAHGLIHKDVSDVKVVIGGAIDPGMEAYKSKLDRFISKCGTSASVIWAGSLSAGEMAWCYSHCAAFVMTSRAEACPNIALEAMSHGCACISTETRPMPEFFGDSAVYYPPKNWKALGGAIRQVLSLSDEMRREFSVRARKRATQFSWDVCAEKTIAELAKAAEDFNKKEHR
jgi:glycosyltransferase involved in cell wall biosynthesis